MQKNKTKKTLLLFASSFLLMSLASACKENTPNVSSSETTTTSQVEESKEPVVFELLQSSEVIGSYERSDHSLRSFKKITDNSLSIKSGKAYVRYLHSRSELTSFLTPNNFYKC